MHIKERKAIKKYSRNFYFYISYYIYIILQFSYGAFGLVIIDINKNLFRSMYNSAINYEYQRLTFPYYL